MPNGKPGDHPLTDILVHGHVLFGEGVEERVRLIAKTCSAAQREFLAILLFSWPIDDSGEPYSAKGLSRILDKFLPLVTSRD